MNIHIKKGNILSFNGNTIINTANQSLVPGFGLDAQIHQFGGNSITENCANYIKKFGNLEPGDTITTMGGRLLQEYIIHAVGPLWKGGNFDEEKILEKTYINCLNAAEKCNTNKVAFPNISTGIFNFPKEKAAEIAIRTITTFQCKNITDIYIYCFENENYKIYNKILKTNTLL